VITRLVAEIRRLSPLSMIAGEVGLLLILAGFPLGNSIGIVLQPLGLLLVIAAILLARSRKGALTAMSLIVLTFVALIVLLVVFASLVAIFGGGAGGDTGEITPTPRRTVP